MLHGPSAELGKDNAISKKNKLGVILFLFYLLVYGGFVFIGIVTPHLMSYKILDQNLSVVYGMGLILLAIIMGIIYNYFCTKFEDQLNQEE